MHNRGVRRKQALQRGPIVFAVEWPDNPQGHVRNLLLKDGAPLAAEFRPGLLNGVEVITGTAAGYVTEPSGKVVKFGVGLGWSNVDTIVDAMSLTQ